MGTIGISPIRVRASRTLVEQPARPRTRTLRWALRLVVASLMLLALPPVARAANPVVEENARPGDPGWNVLDITPGVLEGYANRISALPGDSVDLKISSNSAATYRVEVYRLGWYGGAGGRLMTCLPSCTGSKPAISQPYPTLDPATGLGRAGWTTTDSFTIGSTWVSGYYVAQVKLTSGEQVGHAFTIPLIVRAPATRAKTMLVQASSNTWQAYNKWGGKSVYDSNSTDQARAFKVSFDRPFHRDSQRLYDYDLQLVRFLEREGYDVQYQSGTDTDANPLNLRNFRMVISAGHDEYWSKNMRDAFEAARDAGVHLAFFGANIGYWQMRYEDGGRTMVVYKDRSSDPEPDQTLKTIQFRVLIPARPECELIGVQFGGSISTNLYRNYGVEAGSLGDPWFSGTGFLPGATIPLVIGYEWDDIVPDCAVPGPLTVLLRYDGGTAEPSAGATRYTAPSGARVFAAGTMNWSWKLDNFVQAGYDPVGHGVDARVQALTRNVLNLQPAPVNLPPVASMTRSVDEPQAGKSLTFTDTSTDADGTIAARAWDLDDDGQFDDGTARTAATTFANAGSFTVRLRVTDDDGATNIATMTFMVGVAPPSGGRYTLVQHRETFASATATSATVTTVMSLTRDNVVVVLVGWGSQTGTVKVTDGLGNKYSALGQPMRFSMTNSSAQLFFEDDVKHGGATTITAKFSSSVKNRFMAFGEFDR